MKEIGGYFELENLVDNEYYKDMVRLNNGRNSLIYILKSKKIKKIYLPYFLCDSVANKAIQEGYDVDYYNVDEEFNPIFDKELKVDEYIYIVNFYGQIDNKMLSEYKNKYNRIIVDNTHAFYQKPLIDVDTIYSCRKFFGVPDGAYLCTDTRINEALEIDNSKDRIKHLVGRMSGKASDYYNDFQKSDEDFETEDLKEMSLFTRNILGAIDYKKIQIKRNENFKFLSNKLNSINELRLNVPEGAFSYPLLISEGEKIRQKLIENKVYVSMLWPNVPNNIDKGRIEYYYSKNIIPIPCDQRYDLDDMKYIVNLLKDIIGDEY